ncbi:S8 family serine peptidase [Thermodesulfobacteriota bacterium]
MNINTSKKRIFFNLLVPVFISILVFSTIVNAKQQPINLEINDADPGRNQFVLNISDNLVSLEANGADIRTILTEIAEKAGIQIDIDPRVRGSILISFKDIEIEEAIKRLTGNRGIEFIKTGNDNEYRISKIVIAVSSYDNNNLSRIDKELPNNDRDEVYTIPHTQGAYATIDDYGISAPPETMSNEKTGQESQIISHELVIRFNKEMSDEEISALILEKGASVKTHIESLNYYVLTIPPHDTVHEAMKWFGQKGVVDRVEPNYVIPIKLFPDDTEFAKQWYLHNTGQAGGIGDADIDAPEVWDIERGNEAVVIAVVDTGIDYTHEDISQNIWVNSGEIPDNGLDDDGNGYVDDTIGWDFVDSDNGASDEDYTVQDNDPMDKQGHGTHVAGIIGAVANNEKGVTGVAWNCEVMPVRAGYKASSGDGALESVYAAQAIIYAAENGASIINLSWGTSMNSDLIKDAINFAADSGVLICAAAGNENSESFNYPAASDNNAIIAVGATDINDNKASYSNYGNWVDVSAPGTSIYSLGLDNTYKYMSGTSMATPHVAGLAALIFSYFPEITPVEVKTRIMRSVDILSGLEGRNSTSGRVNAFTALSTECYGPYIFSLNPDSAHEGDQIFILGDGFGGTQQESVVTFHPDKEAHILSWSDTSIKCIVPEGTQPGGVTVATAEGSSNIIDFSALIQYYEETLVENEFSNTGEAQGWKADDRSWQYQLPFSFPFFGSQYDTVYVCSNGFLDFTSSSADNLNSMDDFKSRVMIAPLWDDINTNSSSQQGGDIHIYSPSDATVCIYWTGESYETGGPINVAVILYEDGRIQFDYGEGNTSLSPTIGISGGNGDDYHLSTLDHESELTNAATVLFTPIEQTFSDTSGSASTSAGNSDGGGGGCFINSIILE